MTKKKIDKEKWAEELANKTPETHAAVMKKLGITPKEDRTWHKENGGQPADFSQLEKQHDEYQKFFERIGKNWNS